MKKNSFLTFLFSLLPGAGHMYIGYMNKGLQLMGIFFGVIAISVLLEFSIILFVLPLIFCYSLFDSLHSNRKLYGATEITDDYLLKDIQKYFSIDNRKAAKYLGIGLILIGSLSLLDKVFNYLINMIGEIIGYSPYFLTNILRNLVISIVLILIGIRLLVGKKMNRSGKGD